MNEMTTSLDTVFNYHEQTKHHFSRYARALGYMDWKNQPNPFRHYDGAPRTPLALGDEAGGPLYHQLFETEIPPQKINHASISQLFYYSMALSAWKKIPEGNAWPLRVNPSSGNLHPTESYLIIGSQASERIDPGLHHYLPHPHALEKRRAFDTALWEHLKKQLPRDGFLMGLSSIYWRESWKYGERAFRYCQHDVGHALAAISMAAQSLGWRAAVLDLATDETALLLGLDRQEGIEAEHADCLLIIDPRADQTQQKRTSFQLKADFLTRLRKTPCLGKENRLSEDHHDWPIIEAVSAASKNNETVAQTLEQKTKDLQTKKPQMISLSKNTAFHIIRKRRSAVAMDGLSTLEKSRFYLMLQRLQTNETANPYACLPWRPNIALFIFVHRVTDLEPGLYALVRDPSHLALLKTETKTDFLWEKPTDCPEAVGLFLLAAQDVQEIAAQVSCGQNIAGDGVFSLGMLAHFESSLREKGAYVYPRLFWETGLIGQALYLEAEDAGLQATGIGCFFDDVMHDLLGINKRSWQSLYHFTVGGPKGDDRLQTLPAYHHRQK